MRIHQCSKALCGPQQCCTVFRHICFATLSVCISGWFFRNFPEMSVDMTTTPTCCLLLALLVRTPPCLRPSFFDPDSVPLAWLVTIPPEVALHQVLRFLCWDVSSLSTLRPNVQNLLNYLVVSSRPTAAWVLVNLLIQSTVAYAVAVSMTVLARPELILELFAHRMTLHMSSLPVVSLRMHSPYNSFEF